MPVRERRQVASRIAEALLFLRGEATAATLDTVAAAIKDAELSIGLACRKGRQPAAEEAGAEPLDDQQPVKHVAPLARS